MSSSQEDVQNDDGFTRWLVDADFYGQVQTDLTAARTALSSSSVAAVCAGRDAASRLHGLALTANFADSANFYYYVYEQLCRQLL